MSAVPVDCCEMITSITRNGSLSTVGKDVYREAVNHPLDTWLRDAAQPNNDNDHEYLVIAAEPQLTKKISKQN